MNSKVYGKELTERYLNKTGHKNREVQVDYTNGKIKFSKTNSDLKKVLGNKKMRLFSLAAAGIILVSSGCGSKDRFEYQEKAPKDVITTGLDKVGFGLEYKEEVETSKAYGATTGDINPSEIIRANDGYLYQTEEDASKSSSIGKTVIDTKNDTLVINPDGTVSKKEEGYEVLDKDKNVVLEGEGVIPFGYMILGSDYYNKMTGDLVLSKGSMVNIEDFNRVIEYLTPTQQKNENISSGLVENGPTYDEGKVNSDGTFTKDGLTFESYEDYQQWMLQGYTGYGLDEDGVMRSITNEYNSFEKVR